MFWNFLSDSSIRSNSVVLDLGKEGIKFSSLVENEEKKEWKSKIPNIERQKMTNFEISQKIDNSWLVQNN